MDAAAVDPKEAKLVWIGSARLPDCPDLTVCTVYLGPVFPMLARRKVVDAYDPAKFPYKPEPEYLADWEQSEA